MTDHEQYINAIQQRTSPQTKQVLNIYVHSVVPNAIEMKAAFVCN